MEKKIIGIFMFMLLFAQFLAVPSTAFDQEPSTPIIEGPCTAEIGENCFYTVISTDPQGDDLYYEFRYSDDPSLDFKGGPFKSGKKITFNHCWDDFYQDTNPFFIRVMAVDEYDHESSWGKFEVNVTNAKIGKLNNNNCEINMLINPLLITFLENHHYLFPLIRKILGLM